MRWFSRKTGKEYDRVEAIDAEEKYFYVWTKARPKNRHFISAKNLIIEKDRQ